MQQKWLKGFAILILSALSIFCQSARAARISAGLGFGGSSSTKDATYEESPFIQSYTFEYEYDSRNIFGAEHVRSLGMSPMSTAISYTGLIYKFYYNGIPGPFSDVGTMPANTIEFRDWSPFLGVALGLAQSSAPPEDGVQRSAAGIYIGPKIGTDFAMGRSWGIRTELIFEMMVFGSGSIQSMGLGGGLYFAF